MAALVDFATAGLKRLATSAPVRSLRRMRDSQRFRTATNANLFWGVYSSFAEAQAAAPDSKPLGYDHEEPAQMYAHLMDHVDPKDYAVLYWLERALPSAGRVFDFGGHVGVKYYAFRSIGALAATLRWTVFDVPAVVRAGAELARQRGTIDLFFTEDFAQASGVDVFLALGSLQYIETPLAQKLAALAQPPRAVIISSVPMVEGPRYVTLQNIGTAFCPYLIEDMDALTKQMTGIGYRLRQRWANPEKSCLILDRRDKSVEGYTSLYFER